MLKIIVTGPESSGKTTLCKELSKHFKIPFTKEFAREYLTNLDKDYTQNDLSAIAKAQLASEHNFQLLDTDLITIKIWSEYKYGNCEKWILDQIENQRLENRFYILCSPDIPWKNDSLREHPNNRNSLFKLYKKELEDLEYNYLIVKGENRVEASILKISNLIS
jgi:nicotinamide riboside kinase